MDNREAQTVTNHKLRREGTTAFKRLTERHGGIEKWSEAMRLHPAFAIKAVSNPPGPAS
jgi:hypothetical protein